MSVNYTSLLLAVVFSGLAVLVTAVANGISTNKDRYLIFGTIGLALILTAVGLMVLRYDRLDALNLLAPFVLLLAGLGFIHASTRDFLDKTNRWPSILIGALSIVVTAIPFATGYLGLGNIVLNLTAGLILMLSGIGYLDAREDKRSATLAIATLYIVTGLSFLICAVSVAATGDWVRYPVSDSWVDTFNAIMSLIGLTGIGVLTITLHYARTVRRHHTEANTDPLTGTLNRRGLFQFYAEQDIVPGLPVLLFDLDHFKQINDYLGHAQGDITLKRFSAILQSCLGKNDVIARIGGEEFCVILPEQDRNTARTTAELIRDCLAGAAMPGGKPDTIATVSVGLATGGEAETFSSVLSRADDALYLAKRTGRNKVHQARTEKAA